MYSRLLSLIEQKNNYGGNLFWEIYLNILFLIWIDVVGNPSIGKSSKTEEDGENGGSTENGVIDKDEVKDVSQPNSSEAMGTKEYLLASCARGGYVLSGFIVSHFNVCDYGKNYNINKT